MIMVTYGFYFIILELQLLLVALQRLKTSQKVFGVFISLQRRFKKSVVSRITWMYLYVMIINNNNIPAQ